MKYIFHFVDGREVSYIDHDHGSDKPQFEELAEHIRDNHLIVMACANMPGRYELVNMKYVIRIEEFVEYQDDLP